MAVDKVAEKAAGKAEYYEGMPQLDPAFMPNLIFWLVVTMVVIYLILNRVALPRINAILVDRHEAITNDLEAAEELNRKAEEAEAAYNKALAEARAEAQAIAAEAKAEILDELKAATAKADAEIAARAAESEARIGEIRASAVQSVEEVAGEAAAEIVKALMPEAADGAAVRSAVATAMKG